MRKIAAEWLELWWQDSHATPFQSPHWNLAWWHHLNPGGTLAVVTVRHWGVLTALAPWWLFQNPRTGQRVLTFLGAGVSDCLDVVQPRDHQIRWIPDVARWVLQQLNWDEYDLDEVSGDSPLMGNAASELAEHTRRSSVCPVLELCSSKEAVDGCISPSAARALAYYRRRLARTHDFEIQAADEQNIDSLLSELFRLHRELWSARGQSGVLCGRE